MATMQQQPEAAPMVGLGLRPRLLNIEAARNYLSVPEPDFRRLCAKWNVRRSPFCRGPAGGFWDTRELDRLAAAEAESKLGLRRRWFAGPCTYFVRAGRKGPVKIGRTTNLKNRFKAINNVVPQGVSCLGVLAGDREAEMHSKFANDRIRNEWFVASADVLNFIKANGLAGTWEE